MTTPASSERPLALVTGASRRVGRAVAIELARSGFDLVLTCHRREDALRETIDACRSAARAADGAFAVDARVVDLSAPSGLDRLCDSVAALPRLDALVHNASAYGLSPWGDIDAATVLHHYQVNAMAPLLLTQAGRHSLERSPLPGGAAVVFFGDIHVAGRPRRRYAAYALSKGAVHTMVECLALEMAPRVRVNGIAPGVVAWPDDTPPEEQAQYERRIPLGRSGTPEDAANLVCWLVLEATYLTGEMVRLDGGRWLA